MSRSKILSLVLTGIFLFGITQTFGAEEQSKLIEGAKKEGKVVYWGNGFGPGLAKMIETGFKKRYGLQEFQVIYAPTGTAEVVAKVPQELKVQKLTVDIIFIGVPEFYYKLLRTGELMKYDSPEYRHFPKIPGVFSEPGYWVATTAFCPTAMIWNPKYVKKDMVAYTDLLDPQFKGMVCSLDARKSESGLSGYFGLRKILGKDFFLKLAKQDIFWLGRTTDVAQKVATGERPVAFMGSNRSAYVVAMEGAEIRVSYPGEGVVLLAVPFAILAKAPHPNAAKLLVDYINSEEGQLLIAEKDGHFVGREGLPVPPKVLKYTPSISNINVIPVDWKSVSEEEMEGARKEFQEIFRK